MLTPTSQPLHCTSSPNPKPLNPKPSTAPKPGPWDFGCSQVA